MSTCNWLDLDSLGSWPTMPKNFPRALVMSHLRTMILPTLWITKLYSMHKIHAHTLKLTPKGPWGPQVASGTWKWGNSSCWAVQCRMALALFESWIYGTSWSEIYEVCNFWWLFWDARRLSRRHFKPSCLPPHTSKLCELFFTCSK